MTVSIHSLVRWDLFVFDLFYKLSPGMYFAPLFHSLYSKIVATDINLGDICTTTSEHLPGESEGQTYHLPSRCFFAHQSWLCVGPLAHIYSSDYCKKLIKTQSVHTDSLNRDFLEKVRRLHGIRQNVDHI